MRFQALKSSRGDLGLHAKTRMQAIDQERASGLKP